MLYGDAGSGVEVDRQGCVTSGWLVLPRRRAQPSGSDPGLGKTWGQDRISRESPEDGLGGLQILQALRGPAVLVLLDQPVTAGPLAAAEISSASGLERALLELLELLELLDLLDHLAQRARRSPDRGAKGSRALVEHLSVRGQLPNQVGHSLAE